MAVWCVRAVYGCMRSCNIQPESEVGSARNGRSCAYSGRRRSSSGVLTSEDAAFDPHISASALHEVGRQHGAARGGWRCVPIRPQKRDARGPAGGAAPMGEASESGERLGRTIRGWDQKDIGARILHPHFHKKKYFRLSKMKMVWTVRISSRRYVDWRNKKKNVNILRYRRLRSRARSYENTPEITHVRVHASDACAPLAPARVRLRPPAT